MSSTNVVVKIQELIEDVFSFYAIYLGWLLHLVGTKVIDVEEMVAMFLHILVHDVKNQMIQIEFIWYGEIISRPFNIASC